MKCEECGLDDSLYVCGECDQALCVACDEALHKGGKRKTHVRPLVCGTCRSNATTRCDSCNISACEKCGISHKDHKSEILVTPKVIGVFWDITSCKPSRAEDIKQALNEITQRVGITDFVRTYGDP